MTEQPGWAYFNDGSGMEWSRNHPVNSGEVPDAVQIRRMTYEGFRAKFGHDDVGDTHDQQRERFMAIQCARPLAERGPA